jgi:two-component system, OmpR family, phosphate regulon response regulator PhoB
MPPRDKNRILILDGNTAGIEPLCRRLTELDFSVSVVADGATALQLMSAVPPRLVILDSALPGLEAIELIRRVRRTRELRGVRLIILSSRASEHDIATGLNGGADDYIAKPFSLREVVARVSAVLRCRASEADAGSELSFEDLVLNSSCNRVTARGKLINLRAVEYRLLEFLMSHAGRAFNRGQLLVNVWGRDRDVDERTVDVNVQRLRKILGGLGYESCIETVRGFGYRFAAPPAAGAMACIANDAS